METTEQITQPCMLFQPRDSDCQNAPPPASPSLWRQWPGAKMCGCSHSLLCLTSWLPIRPSSRWPSESSPSPCHRECYPCHLEQHFCCSKPKWIWREAGSWSWGETFPDPALWPWLLPVQCLLGKLNTSWSSVPFSPPQSQGLPAVYPVDQHILKWCLFPPADFHASFHRGAPSVTGTSHHQPNPNTVPSEPQNLFFPRVEGSDTALSSLSLWVVT